MCGLNCAKCEDYWGYCEECIHPTFYIPRGSTQCGCADGSYENHECNEPAYNEDGLLICLKEFVRCWEDYTRCPKGQSMMHNEALCNYVCTRCGENCAMCGDFDATCAECKHPSYELVWGEDYCQCPE